MALDQEFLKSIGIDDESIAEKLVAKSVEDETGLINKRDELLGKVTGYKEKLQNFEGVDVEEYRALKEKMDQISEAEAIKNGEFDKVREKMLDEFQKKENGWQERNKTLMTQLESMMVDSEVAKAIAEAKGNTALLMPLLKQRIKVVDKDGQLVVKVTEENGDPAVNDKGEPLTISALVDSFKANETYAGAFDSSGLSGGGIIPGAPGSGAIDDDKLFGSSRISAARAKQANS